MNQRKFAITAAIAVPAFTLVAGMAIGASWERATAPEPAAAVESVRPIVVSVPADTANPIPLPPMLSSLPPIPVMEPQDALPVPPLAPVDVYGDGPEWPEAEYPLVDPGAAVLTEPDPESPELVAYTFDEAIGLCEVTYSEQTQELEDCTHAAIISWCMFEPFTPESEFYDPEVDGRCLAEQGQ